MKKAIVVLIALIFSTASYAENFRERGLTITHVGVKADEYSYFKTDLSDPTNCPYRRVNIRAIRYVDIVNEQGEVIGTEEVKSFTHDTTYTQVWKMFRDSIPIEFLNYSKIDGECWVNNIRAASYDSDYTLLDYQVNGGFKCEGPIVSGMKYHYEIYDGGWVPGGTGTMTNCQSNAAAQLLYPTRWQIEINGWKSNFTNIIQ